MAQTVETAGLSSDLPPLSRLAVAYAPRSARPAWIALLLLDQRLSRTVADASSPLLAQLKLAWWRDRMRTSAAQWPRGEPLLAALTPFDGERPALEALVDGWEGLLDEETGEGAWFGLAQARAVAVAALARTLECAVDPEPIATLTRRWTKPDGAHATPLRLPRALRPLLIVANAPPSGTGGAAMIRIVRLGLFGR